MYGKPETIKALSKSLQGFVRPTTAGHWQQPSFIWGRRGAIVFEDRERFRHSHEHANHDWACWKLVERLGLEAGRADGARPPPMLHRLALGGRCSLHS